MEKKREYIIYENMSFNNCRIVQVEFIDIYGN